MDSPQTINGLMRHLRNNCNIQIGGSYQKQQLISYGYYHGYKGYRFVKHSKNRLALSNFSELVAVIEYDNALKASLYPNLMFIETAIKNIVCNESVKYLKSSTFEHIYQERMNDNTTNTKLQTRRLKLRNSVYSKLFTRYRDEEDFDNQMVRHFYNRGEDAPLWVVFEIIYLSDLALFFECLNKTIRKTILSQLSMLDLAIDTNSILLSSILFTLKDLRNAVAHNGIIFDSRFKNRKINTVLKLWFEQETRIQNITLNSLIDYIIIACCLLKRIDFSNNRAIQLLENYKNQNILLQNQVSPEIYDQIIQKNVSAKIQGLELYLNC